MSGQKEDQSRKSGYPQKKPFHADKLFTCSELIFRCYYGKQQTNVIHPKKLKILLTLVGTSKDPPSHQPSQQRHLVPKHSSMLSAVAALQMARHAVADAAAATAQAFHARTTASAREETSAVVLWPASRWTSKKGMWMMNKCTLYLLVIYTCMYIRIVNKSIQMHIRFIFSTLLLLWATKFDHMVPCHGQ
jgi:hypothetical protein